MQHLGRLGAGLAGQHRDLASVAHTLVDHLLGVFGVLADPLFRRDRLGQIAQQGGKLLEALAGHLELAPRQRLHAFGGELVGLAQRLDIAPLRRPDGLNIDRRETEIGEEFGHVIIEKAGTGIRHGRVPI